MNAGHASRVAGALGLASALLLLGAGGAGCGRPFDVKTAPGLVELEHQEPDYQFRAISPEGVVMGWLAIPEHCANLMDSAYTQMGAGFAVNPQSRAGIYWALELGRPAGK